MIITFLNGILNFFPSDSEGISHHPPEYYPYQKKKKMSLASISSFPQLSRLSWANVVQRQLAFEIKRNFREAWLVSQKLECLVWLSTVQHQPLAKGQGMCFGNNWPESAAMSGRTWFIFANPHGKWGSFLFREKCGWLEEQSHAVSIFIFSCTNYTANSNYT